MIVWGGSDGASVLPDGARYDPLTDAWSPMAQTAQQHGRREHTAVWTGSEMIVWGGAGTGDGAGAGGVMPSGGRFDPVLNTWEPISGPGFRLGLFAAE